VPDVPVTLRQLLNEWDPIGVFDPVIDDPDGDLDVLRAPDDEYDCLSAPLLERLRQGAGADAITGFLDRELRDHFGLALPLALTADFAGRLVRWYRTAGSG
jgi:hypothetical protein